MIDKSRPKSSSSQMNNSNFNRTVNKENIPNSRQLRFEDFESLQTAEGLNKTLSNIWGDSYDSKSNCYLSILFI